MSMLAILVCGGFGLLSLVGIGMGIKGALTEAPPFMKGEGQVGRFDARMGKAA